MWLDTQLTAKTDIPSDIEGAGITGEQLGLYDPYRAVDRRNNQDLDNNGALIRILRNTDIDIALRTIGNAFFPRVVTVPPGQATLLIQPNRSPRGYIIINPNQTTSGIVTDVTVFPVGNVFPVATTPSASIPVSAFGGAAFILDVTEANLGTVSVDLQTQDPISGNWATAQSDIFNFGPGPAAIGTYYANVGGLGIDENARISVTVTGDTFTGSLAAILKPALAGTIAGPTVFLGGPDVNTTIGFPLLAGNERTFYLKENTPLYGAAVASTTINIFELQ